MLWFEERYIFNDNNIFKPYIKLWKRFRDDIYTIWNGGHDTLDCFFWQLNYKEPKIQFTIEREKHGILAFLDISIHRLADRLATKVYRSSREGQTPGHRVVYSIFYKFGLLIQMYGSFNLK